AQAGGCRRRFCFCSTGRAYPRSGQSILGVFRMSGLMSALGRATPRPWLLAAGLALAMLAGCDNSPWPKGSAESKLVYTAMIENTPRHLDPTASYWSNDTMVTYQVYEPPYGYHYLKRPYELVPKSVEKVVAPKGGSYTW